MGEKRKRTHKNKYFFKNSEENALNLYIRFLKANNEQRIHIHFTNLVASITCDPIVRPDQEKKRLPAELLGSMHTSPHIYYSVRECSAGKAGLTGVGSQAAGMP